MQVKKHDSGAVEFMPSPSHKAEKAREKALTQRLSRIEWGLMYLAGQVSEESYEEMSRILKKA